MKRTLITIALAAQLAAVGAFAQTSTTTTGTTGSGAGSATFGSDWSRTLGSVMFGEDGTTVRQSTELSTQWNTLSEEDKAMIQRDCLVYTQQSGGTASSTGAATDATRTTGAAGTTAGTTTDSSTTMSVTMEQMEEICAATKDL